MKILGLLFAWLIGFGMAAGSVFGLEKNRLTVRGDPRPGGVLFVSLQADSNAESVEGEWRGLKVPFARIAREWRALLPVSRGARAGSVPIHVTLITNQGSIHVSRSVSIRFRFFPHQSLWLPRSQVNKYEDPSVKAEYAILDRALATVTREEFPIRSFVLPVRAPVTTGYGLSRSVNGEPAGWHRGIDLAGGHGTSIRAPAPGRVILVRQRLKIHGNVVVLDHGFGLLSLYLHLDHILVREGVRVRQGERIGTVGSTGIATGPHLHWGTYLFGVPVDPRALFRFPSDWS